jgi:hypothetical protein
MRRRTLFWSATALLAIASVVVVISAPDTAVGQTTFTNHVYVPQLLDAFAGPYPTAPVPTMDIRQTATPTLTPVPRPTRTPTPTTAPIDYPRSKHTIIMQIGWTYTETVGSVWQEMEGTAWLTLYGDGRLVAGHELLDRAQDLYVTQLPEQEVWDWMNTLAYQVTFFSLASAYDHPDATKPSLHVYCKISAGSWRVTLRGWEKWTGPHPPNTPGAGDAMRLVQYVQEREAYVKSQLQTPYEADSYTILAQQLRPSLIPDAPAWPYASLDVTAIADAAPLAKPSPIDRLVGHMFVDSQMGKEVRDLIVPVADGYFPFEYRAAEFKAGGRPIAVGARQEVEGGSLFLPPNIWDGWYRKDYGPGDPPLLAIPGLGPEPRHGGLTSLSPRGQ